MTAERVPAGVFAPVATTFGDDGGLDLEAFHTNLSWYATSPLDGVVILGSNGESALLETDEKLRLIEAGVAAVGGQKTVMAGTGLESTRATIDLTRQAAALGIDYALIVTPHYYKPKYDHAAYLAHYRAVADAAPVPILIYIMTTYTGVDLSTALVAELSGHPNIAGVKDSGGNAPKVAEMVARAAPGFGVLAGSASFLYPALCLGATGGILALGNIAPGLCKEIETCFKAGDHDEARRLQQRALAPNAAVTTQFGIAGLKAAMDAVGLRGGKPRPPLEPLNERDASEVRRILGEAEIGPVV
ncbi:MAG: dihydrodipicolinate synthase family protein [Chloroflexota bacterium]|nr:dihydrodipicolinate synthase family protein [Chloroflexota bacterium]